MKKIILSLFLLVGLVFSVALAPEITRAQTSVNPNTIGCTVINVPPVLKMGSTGIEVSKLQNFLIAMGYLNIPQATGYFGPLTRQATIQFQIDYSLTPDGVVGVMTAAVIKNLTCNNTSQNPNIPNSNTNVGPSAPTPTTPPNTTTPTTPTNTNNPTNTTNNTNTNSSNTNSGTTQSLSLPCNTTTTPFAEVIDPNGGEVFNINDVVKVVWETCNIPQSAPVKVVLMYMNTAIMATTTTNVGSHTFQLSPTILLSTTATPQGPVTFGNNFSAMVTASVGSVTYFDSSNANFTILNNSVTPTTPTSPTNPTTGLPSGCTTTTAFSPTSGVLCNPHLVGCLPGYLYSPITGNPCPPTSTPTNPTTTPTTPTNPTAQQVLDIFILDSGISPATVGVVPGTQVTWINKTTSDRKIVDPANLFSSALIPSGGTHTFTFNIPGVYKYQVFDASGVNFLIGSVTVY